MPRGVYERKSAPKKPAKPVAKGKAKATGKKASAPKKAAGKVKAKAKAATVAKPARQVRALAVLPPAAAAPIEIPQFLKPPAGEPETLPGATIGGPVVPSTTVPDLTPEPPKVYTRQDFRRSVDTMEGDLLKAYARSLGIMQRDVDSLTEDRLRQNCKVRVYDAIEAD